MRVRAPVGLPRRLLTIALIATAATGAVGCERETRHSAGTFDVESTGDVAFTARGQIHGRLTDPLWTDGKYFLTLNFDTPQRPHLSWASVITQRFPEPGTYQFVSGRAYLLGRDSAQVDLGDLGTGEPDWDVDSGAVTFLPGASGDGVKGTFTMYANCRRACDTTGKTLHISLHGHFETRTGTAGTP